MNIGEMINTSMGQLLILDIQKRYLILFDTEGAKFIKANGYEVKQGKAHWNGGEYYNSLNDLIAGLEYN